VTLTNQNAVQTTATMTSAMLVISADRIGLVFGSGQAPLPADPLSRGRVPAPRNPEPEQLRSRHGWSAAHMRKQVRAGTPDAVPPTGPVGYRPPGTSADRVAWLPATDPVRDRDPKGRVTLCTARDCQSPVRRDAKRPLARVAAPAAVAGK